MHCPTKMEFILVLAHCVCVCVTLIFRLQKLQDSEDNAKNNKSPRSNTLTQTLDAEIVQFSKSCDFALEIRCTL